MLSWLSLLVKYGPRVHPSKFCVLSTLCGNQEAQRGLIVRSSYRRLCAVRFRINRVCCLHASTDLIRRAVQKWCHTVQTSPECAACWISSPSWRRRSVIVCSEFLQQTRSLLQLIEMLRWEYEAPSNCSYSFWYKTHSGNRLYVLFYILFCPNCPLEGWKTKAQDTLEVLCKPNTQTRSRSALKTAHHQSLCRVERFDGSRDEGLLKLLFLWLKVDWRTVWTSCSQSLQKNAFMRSHDSKHNQP